MVDTNTDLFCIFGNPVAHSKSPVMHNALFNENKINAVYLAFDIDNIKTGINAVRELNIKGVSITIPFKEKVLEYLDYIDEQANAIGAVNTIVNKNGKLKGYNTDWLGGIEPIKEYGIKEKKIGLIGAGGAAHAIAYGIKKNKGRLTIINRNEKTGEHLASIFSSNYLKIDEIKNESFDIIINTTPLGMTPDINNSPLKKELLNKHMIVMDIVYNPLETKLIKDAKKIGCKTIDGLSMFLYQGAHQFKLWTGITPSIELMRKIVIKELK
ncbi:MAG: shikimate dehydrogenase [Desulfobacteraceae bacterium]|nr:shikimate dehydrogenase [Desulfobacteraceae bacterium]